MSLLNVVLVPKTNILPFVYVLSVALCLKEVSQKLKLKHCCYGCFLFNVYRLLRGFWSEGDNITEKTWMMTSKDQYRYRYRKNAKYR